MVTVHYIYLMRVVHIAEPCHRKPENMEPVSGGFFCDECCKVVIDFREKSNEEILSTLSNRGSERLCGYFNKSQASRGKLTFQLARFAAAVLLVFGSVLFVTSSTGCGGGMEPSVDSMLYMQADSIRIADSIAASKAATDTISDSIK